MRKKINGDLVNAIKKAIKSYGSQSELARLSGTSQSTINSIINPKRGRTFVIDSVLEKLLPFVSPYMEGASTVMKKVENSGNIAVGSNNNFFTPGALPAGNIPPEVLQQTMATMSPEEKARFLKELYSDTDQKTDLQK